MKTNRWILIAAAIAGVLLICAFAVVPAVRLSRGDNTVDVSYRGAQASGDVLTLTVSYGSADDAFFEIGRDIIVSADRDFSNPLQMRNCSVDEGGYVYEFSLGSARAGDLNTVYVQPPILYMPAEITPVSVPLAAGETAALGAAATNSGAAEPSWFSIRTVDVEESTKGTYLVRLVIDAEASDLPRFPKLCVGDEQIGGTAAFDFDENDQFDSGEFLFYVNAGSEEEAKAMLENASLLISDALLRVDASQLTIFSDTRALSVVVDG